MPPVRTPPTQLRESLVRATLREPMFIRVKFSSKHLISFPIFIASGGCFDNGIARGGDVCHDYQQVQTGYQPNAYRVSDGNVEVPLVCLFACEMVLFLYVLTVIRASAR